MIIHPIFALIKGEEVLNTMVCDDGYTMANDIAHAAFGEDAFAVEVSQLAVSMGDLYKEGNFYKIDPDTGEEFVVNVTPTAEEELPYVKDQLTSLEEYALNMDYSLALMQLGI
ncbi:MAG: hypothetical protein HFE83_02445 [Lachnospiraceae bacterium]|jgi:hypothetical protein|nr:hypothetical protein [Lachnospiraceae bacterium]